MEFFRRAGGHPKRLAILSGTFNPPTRAHLALARAALEQADEVLFVLPRTFPHKPYEGASFEERVQMLLDAAAGEPRYSIAATDAGLFIDIARECRPEYGTDAALQFLCGADAAERIVCWDYGTPGAFLQMLGEFELLVACRGRDYEPPVEMRGRIHSLALDEDYGAVSATEVRKRIGSGGEWEHLVPKEITPIAERIYRRGADEQRQSSSRTSD
jgi:nicotinate-nucleotide adenylyltransferase